MNGFLGRGLGKGLGRAGGRGSRGASLLALIIMGAGTMGCGSVASEYDVDADFTVTPKIDGAFFWWNEITLDSDVNSYGAAKLGFVRLDVQPPAEDLTFIHDILGEAVTSTARTPLVQKKSMPKGEPNVVLDVLHEGDVRPFFEDGKKVRVEWTGSTDPNFLAWPPGGIQVAVKVRLVLE